MIRPLSLVSFERYMLEDDTPSWPMNIFFRLRFDGAVDRGGLERAAAAALARHPLLSARIASVGGHTRWVDGGRSAPDIRWTTGGHGTERIPVTGIDLRTGTGLRLLVGSSADSSEILVQIHHACCDGLGAFFFIEDLLVIYAMEWGTPTVDRAPRSLDPALLCRREDLGLSWRGLPALVRRQLKGARGIGDFFFRRPLSLADTLQRPVELHDTYPAAVTSSFDREETAAIGDSAAREGVMVNDLLARDLLVSLGEWVLRRRQAGERDVLRLLIPVSRRRRKDRRMPAANMVGYAFLTAPLEDLANPERLLSTIQHRLAMIRRNRLERSFLLWGRAVLAVPGAGRRMAGRDRCWATAVLSNLGAPLSRAPLPCREGLLTAGDLVLKGMDILAPIRQGTVAAFCVFKYARKLHVTLHYDPRPLGAAAGAELLGVFMDRLRRTAGGKV